MWNWFKRKQETAGATAKNNLPVNDPELALLMEKAEQGEAESRYQLGLLYLDGKGIKKNEKLAAELFKKAMEQGHLDAQRKLAFCYLYGRGVKQHLAYSLELSQAADGTNEKIDMNKFGALVRK